MHNTLNIPELIVNVESIAHLENIGNCDLMHN